MCAVYRLQTGPRIDLKVPGNGKASPSGGNSGSNPQIPVFRGIIFLLRWFKVSRNVILNNKQAGLG